MASARERVLEAIGQHQWHQDRIPLQEVDEAWRSDHEVVLAAVQRDGRALEFAAEELQGDREIVLLAVQDDGHALQWATEALRGDHKIVLAAVQKDGGALRYATEAVRADPEIVQAAVQEYEFAFRFAADCLLEDANFATEANRYYLLKLTMLSGRSTVVAADDYWTAEVVLEECCFRLGLADDGTTMELWHTSGERVPDDGTEVKDWPGVHPPGEISAYQLVVT